MAVGNSFGNSFGMLRRTPLLFLSIAVIVALASEVNLVVDPSVNLTSSQIGQKAMHEEGSGRFGAAVWSIDSEREWLFGGHRIATDRTFTSDLWLHERNNTWRWLAGSRTEDAGVYDDPAWPGARANSCTWTITNQTTGEIKRYMFGGRGFDEAGDSEGLLNDFWQFFPNELKFTFIGGTRMKNQTGMYGVRLLASITNMPGARENAICWTIYNRYLWMNGGVGCDDRQHCDVWAPLNDVWRFDTVTGMWTWLRGSPKHGNAKVFPATEMPQFWTLT